MNGSSIPDFVWILGIAAVLAAVLFAIVRGRIPRQGKRPEARRAPRLRLARARRLARRARRRRRRVLP